MADPNKKFFGISPTVLMLGFVSLLTDISSEGIYPLIPLFLTNILHAQASTVGLIEGVAESTASILRIFSGWLSDRIGNRKWITVAGYSLSALSKPLLSISTLWEHVFAVRFMDRMGKGIRSAPRDALIADVTPADKRGISFGFHRAMDTVGAVLGPLIVFWLLRSMHMQYRRLFLLAAIPGVIGVLLLVFLVREPRRPASENRQEMPSLRLGIFGKQFKMFLLVTTIFAIGNSSDAFLILRAKNLGISASSILLIIVLFNSVEALLATFAGAVSDRVGRKNVILVGYLIFAGVYAGFGLATRPAEIVMLFAFYGLYNTLTNGVQKAFATDLIAAEIRGTGLGAYNMLTGLALLPASLIAGYLWDAINPSAPFYFGAATALISGILLVILFRGSVIYNDR